VCVPAGVHWEFRGRLPLVRRHVVKEVTRQRGNGLNDNESGERKADHKTGHNGGNKRTRCGMQHSRLSYTWHLELAYLHPGFNHYTLLRPSTFSNHSEQLSLPCYFRLQRQERHALCWINYETLIRNTPFLLSADSRVWLRLRIGRWSIRFTQELYYALERAC
jgi:hypothetical protein